MTPSARVDAADSATAPQLTVTVSTLHFRTHPLCTAEDTAAAALVAAHREWSSRHTADVTGAVDGRLAALRVALQQCEQQIAAGVTAPAYTQSMDVQSAAAREHAQLEARAAAYRTEIDAVRDQRDASAQRDHAVLAAVLQAWAAVKAARTAQGFVLTPWTVVVYRQPTDAAVEHAWLLGQAHAELAERRAAYEAQQRLQVRAVQDRAARRAMAAGQVDAANVDAVPANLRVPFDEQREWAAVVARLGVGRRQPGEPVLTPVLQDTRPITPPEVCVACYCLLSSEN